MSIGPYFVGDVPVRPAVIEVERDGHDASLGDFDSVTASLAGPDGRETPLAAAMDAFSVRIDWPEASPFLSPGVHFIRLTFTNVTGSREEAAAEPVVVQADDGWLSLDGARRLWADAPMDDEHLFRILLAARAQCAAFAPAFTGRPPVNYVQAQLLQARALWSSGNVSQNDGLGGEGLTVTVFPMDWTVKNLLRPKRAIGAFF